MITKAQILNGADQARHFDVAIGDGHPIGYTNLGKSPIGSHFQDVLNKTHYVKTADNGEEADWTAIGGTSNSPTVPVIPLDGEDFILGKKVSELQQDVVFGADNKIYGTLHSVKDYKGYDSEQTVGNYLAFYVPILDGCTATVKKGSNDAVALDDGLVVLKITDTSISVVVSITDGDSNTVSRTFTLTELTCE